MGLFRKKDKDSSEGKDSKKGFKCSDCDMVFDEKERMQRHRRKAHSEKGGDMPNANPFGGF